MYIHNETSIHPAIIGGDGGVAGLDIKYFLFINTYVL
jgi:hypothetical protein